MRDVTISLNRNGLNSVEVEQDQLRVSTAGSMVIENHGKPTHVHLHLNDDLASIAAIEDTHWYVPAGESRSVELEAAEGAAGRGRIEIATGYGQQTTDLDVVIGPEDAEGEASDSASEPPAGGAETDEESAAEGTAALADRLGSGIDVERVTDPLVGGAAIGFLIVLFALFAIEPVAAIGALFAAVLLAVAAIGYVSGDGKADTSSKS